MFLKERRKKANLLKSDSGFAHDVTEPLLVVVERLGRRVGIASMLKPQDDGVHLLREDRTLLHDPAEDVAWLHVAQLVVLSNNGKTG